MKCEEVPGGFPQGSFPWKNKYPCTIQVVIWNVNIDEKLDLNEDYGCWFELEKSIDLQGQV